MRVHTAFGSISAQDGDATVHAMKRAIIRAEKKNIRLFGTAPRSFSVRVVYSAAAYDRACGLQGIETSRAGYALQRKIIVISPELQTLPFDMNSFFMHEINHMFYYSLAGSCMPVWYSEGMATYHMGTYKLAVSGWKKYFRAVQNPERLLTYRYMRRKYFLNIRSFYPLCFLVYRYLHQTYGKITINLLKDYAKEPTQKRFNLLCKKHFEGNLRDIVQRALK